MWGPRAEASVAPRLGYMHITRRKHHGVLPELPKDVVLDRHCNKLQHGAAEKLLALSELTVASVLKHLYIVILKMKNNIESMQSLQRTHYVTLPLFEIFLLDFSQGGKKKLTVLRGSCSQEQALHVIMLSYTCNCHTS